MMGALLQEGTWLDTPWSAPDSFLPRPSFDPDALAPRSVRSDVPAVYMPLRGGPRSLAAIGRAFVAALHEYHWPKLEALVLDEEEFTTLLWPEFPYRRRLGGLRAPDQIQANDAWALLSRLHRRDLSRALIEWGGKPLEFVRLERSLPVERYRNFRLHRGLVLWVLDGDGCLEPLDVLQAVVERDDIFKIFRLSDSDPSSVPSA